MQGRHTAVEITLTQDDQRTLQHWLRQSTLLADLMQHARMVLLRHSGVSIAEIARRLGQQRRFVYKWLYRFQGDGLEGVQDRRKGQSGRKPLAV